MPVIASPGEPSTAAEPVPSDRAVNGVGDVSVSTVADLLERLGDIAPARVRLSPPLGTATAADARAANDRRHGLCELVDGTLVEKPMGMWESVIAGIVIRLLGNFVYPGRLGVVTAPDATFTTWDRLAAADGGQEVPAPRLGPDLAVEVLSPSNTPAEIARKRRELFATGTRLMWIVDRPRRTFTVYVDAEGPAAAVRGVGDVVDGGDVLPGFTLDVADVFAQAERPPAA